LSHWPWSAVGKALLSEGDERKMCKPLRTREKPSGWILTEMLPALVLGCLLTAFVFQSALAIRRCMETSDRALLARHMLVASLGCVARDLRMAGCNPYTEPGVGGLELQAAPSTAWEVRIERDVRGESAGSLPDGDAEDPDERLIYRWEASSNLLSRSGQPLANHVLLNPDGEPPFSLRTRAGRALVSVRLTLGMEATEEKLSLTTAVLVRNPIGGL